MLNIKVGKFMNKKYIIIIIVIFMLLLISGLAFVIYNSNNVTDGFEQYDNIIKDDTEIYIPIPSMEDAEKVYNDVGSKYEFLD